MPRLFRSDNERIKNQELVEYANVQEQLNNWTIPPVNSSTIYGRGVFDFMSTMAIKTMERTESVESNDKIINLMNRNDLLYHMRRYKYVHIGLVQIALKPLTLLGMDTAIQVTLRDGRCNRWRSSLMGAIETSLSHGPVYFNAYPNLTLSLTDRNIGETLNCRIQTHGYDFLPGSEVIAVIYRIYYKLMNTINPRVRRLNSSDSTVLIETNMLTSNIATNRLINWEEINFPETWTIPNAVPPRPIINRIEQIVQDNEGTISLNFRNSSRIPRSLSARTDNIVRPYRVSIPTSARNSVSEINEQRIPMRDEVMESEILGLRMSNNNIPHGVYQNVSQRRESPTRSEMSFNDGQD